MTKRLTAVVAAVVCLSGCSGSPGAPTPVTVGGSQSSPPFSGIPAATWIGAGDIADCGAGAALTATLLDRIDGTVFTAGDNAYPSGTLSEFQTCYEPTWGRHRDRTRPVPGNHDYNTAGAAPYFQHFGAAAGAAGQGYYSYALGSWHIVALNSEVDARAGSPQEQWLRAELAANRSRCTAVYWHRPVFSSGPHGGSARMLDAWRALYELDADLLVSAHAHIYERFAPQDAAGGLDLVRGIRQFVVGTGGAALHTPRAAQANSEVTASVWGVLAFTLEPDGYRWRFLSTDNSFRDEGRTACH